MSDAPRRDLSPLLRPSSVAVYGASRDPAKLGHTLLRNVIEDGFSGEVIAVNPRGGEILGCATVPRLERAVDLALVSVPAAVVPDAVADAAAAGCRVAVVLSSGFGETGTEGERVETRLTAVAAEAGMALVGPNCMGVLSRLEDGWLNGTYFWDLPLQEGHVSFVSQSGAVGGMFFSEARRRGLGLARFVSVGNAADVGATDVLEALADDPETSVIGMFLEAIDDGRRFVDVASSAAAPIVVLKAGKAAAGARAAASHTGSLAGTHGAARAGFVRAGVIEAADSDELFDVLAVAAATSPARGSRIAIVTVSGGPSVLAADAAETAGLSLPVPSDDTTATLQTLTPFAAIGNPFDLTPQCPPETFAPALAAVFSDPAFDGVVAINCGLDVESFGTGLAAAAESSGKPTVAFTLDVPEVDAALDAAGIPRLPSPERAVRAYAAELDR